MSNIFLQQVFTFVKGTVSDFWEALMMFEIGIQINTPLPS